MARLDNGLVRIEFDAQTGLLTHFMDLEGGVAHIAPPDAPVGLWKLVFRAGAEEKTLIWPSWKGEATVEVVTEADGAQVAKVDLPMPAVP